MHVVRNLNQLEIGDVLIKGGSPGHAMIVADMAKNERGKIIYLLVQGFMPAQDIHVVNNPADPGLSPWFDLDKKTILTPGWKFTNVDFKHW